MVVINLRVYYPDVYKCDFFVEVADEIATALIKAQRQETAY